MGPGDYAGANDVYQASDVDNASKPVRTGPLQLIWPVRNIKKSRGFLKSGRRPHYGLDLAGRRNESIVAAHDGTVIYAGRGFRGYGKMVLLEYNENWATLYAHLNFVKVKTGQVIKAGKKLGGMGRTGRASGVHLHFEVLKNKIPIDPEKVLDTKSTVAETR